MTALIRLRLPLRALSSLGLLMVAVVIGLGATDWAGRDPGGPAARAVAGPVLQAAATGQPSSEPVPASGAGDSAISGTTSGGTGVWVLPRHLRMLVGAVVTTGLPSGFQPYWVTILGLGLYLSAAADGDKLRRLFSGRRHGVRAPPLHF